MSYCPDESDLTIARQIEAEADAYERKQRLEAMVRAVAPSFTQNMLRVSNLEELEVQLDMISMASLALALKLIKAVDETAK